MIRMESAHDLLPEHLINRDLSWLEYLHRLLEEASEPRSPLLERTQSLSLAAEHLDELFSSQKTILAETDRSDSSEQDASGLTPVQLRGMLNLRAHSLSSDMHGLFLRELLPELAQNGIRFTEESRLTDAQKQWLDQYFEQQVYPLLAPQPLSGSSASFPAGISLHLGILLQGTQGNSSFFDILLPRILPRLIQVPSAQGILLIPLEQLVSRCINRLFFGRIVLSAAAYRVTRASSGQAVRLEIDRRADEQMVSDLQKKLTLQENEIYLIHGPVGLSDFLKPVVELPGHEHLRSPLPSPCAVLSSQDNTLLRRIRREDLLVCRPHDDPSTFIRLLEEAAADPQVLVIRAALSASSVSDTLLQAFSQAVASGKQLCLLLPSGFWGAHCLTEAGAQVVFQDALSSDLALIVRQEQNELRYYACLSTGSPSVSTCAAGHDLYTCSAAYAQDTAAMFNHLIGCSDLPPLRRLVNSPQNLRAFLLQKIEQEAQNALQGKKSDIFAKVNSLEDPELIAALYRASMCGVRVRFVVRDVCCLRPGLPELSESIQIRAFISHHPENSRIIGFENDGKHLIFLSNADWTQNCLDQPGHWLFPLENAKLAGQVITSLRLQWHDTERGRELLSNGQYIRIPSSEGQPNNDPKESPAHENT